MNDSQKLLELGFHLKSLASKRWLLLEEICLLLYYSPEALGIEKTIPERLYNKQ